MSPELSIVIPCYQERENLPTLLDRCRGMYREGLFEVILVDNGSVDGSQALIESAPQHGYPFVVPVRLDQNAGYGGGILAGLLRARGGILAWTHGDLQTDPSDVLRAYALFRHSHDRVVVKGKRLHRSFQETIFTAGMSLVASLLSGVTLRDINAQPKLFDRGFYDSFLKTNPPRDFALDLYWMRHARRNGFGILEIPVEFRSRTSGESKSARTFFMKFGTARRMLRAAWRLRRD